jgi:glutathione S-transferase
MKAPGLSLYHFESCPYCERVRSALRRLEIDVEMRDIHTTPRFGQELTAATGKSMVPCLRIEEPGKPARWMHESLDIIAYLEEEVAPRR